MRPRPALGSAGLWSPARRFGRSIPLTLRHWLLWILSWIISAPAAVHVFVTDSNNRACTNGLVSVRFQDGELETARSVHGPWTGTGNRSGFFVESPGVSTSKFYRVHNH